MIPKSVQLPLLIKEKVEYYYYFDKWKYSIKILHNQYKEKLEMFDDEYGVNIFYWRNSPCPLIPTGYANTICNIEGRSHRHNKQIKEFYDRKGRFFDYPVAWLPPKYHYSSGLNNPNGYKSQ
jgi:hypothetical protein